MDHTFDGGMTSLKQGTFTREWPPEAVLDPDIVLLSSTSNQLTFLLHRGALRRKIISSPASDWKTFHAHEPQRWRPRSPDATGTIWYRGSDKHLLRVIDDRFEPLSLTPPAGHQSSQ